MGSLLNAVTAIANVVWPPGYYIIRDRVPFYFTLIYIYKDRIPLKIQRIIGTYLLLVTALFTGIALGVFDDMTALVGIHWSAPSPVEWGLFIITWTITLQRRGIEMLDSYYMSFIAAFGGGWLYETPNWIIGGIQPMLLFKVNAIKVFFVEFQILCLPILLYLVHRKYLFKASKWFIPVILFVVAFYGFGYIVKPFFYYSIGHGVYKWFVRLPIVLLLSLFLYNIKGVKQVENNVV